ncbi:hypothetical protein NCAS_0D04320 [Naumovozyma castellii]|uniref:DNA repair protein RAD14 n=1 Tax=Naumovozyma castellii TaxID=27288 RepID=G0VEM2_NAUCA|nr:hypothetical protein NCAS_0D04320 [Naumovozyma castellii CBS 4309]CCC70013.1 hypothetical protein NCAS_0D04320 [Naumovozyma castellii CBS 4309]
MNAEQKARLEANRRQALERLKKRGILNQEQAKRIESRNEPLAKVVSTPPPLPSSISTPVSNTVDKPHNAATQNQVNQNGKRPLDNKIRPSVRKEDYIEYDFATMKNLHGGYINPEDRTSGYDYDFDDEFGNDIGSKKQKSLDDWKREQQERKALYENAPPPEHISKAPKCIECNINIEMDPVLNDVFKLQVCKSCAKDHPEKYSLLTKTECKEDYFLTDPELNDPELFHRLEKPNPHSGTFARMQLFVRCEIEKFAWKKWGGEEGLDKEWQRREEGKSERREKKYQKQIKEMRIRTRAQEYTVKLRERKYGKTHVHQFSEPIEGGKDEDGNTISRRRCIECGLETEEVMI